MYSAVVGQEVCRETRALKMRCIVAGHRKLTATNREDHWSRSSPNYMRRYWRTQRSTILRLCGIWSTLERWKSLISGASWADHKSKKNHPFEVSSSLIPHNNEPLLDWIVIYNEQWNVWQLVITSSMAGPRRSSKALPKAKLVPKKVMVTVSWSAAGLIPYSFLNPGEIITSEKYAQQIDEMHRKLQCL